MNPGQATIMMMFNQFASDPRFKQAQAMAQGKTPEQLWETCGNLCRQRGIDLNQAWAQFQSQFGLK